MKHEPPGQLAAGVDPDVIMMVCTAGHVDHGKTSLVKLLTGCNTDRLKAEQERGLTIELGFAPCVLEGNLCVGIVDVPGHEKFIRNMVAGVSGIDMTILVVASDDGIMPQTVEHFQIMELLGVRHGIVALTKTDLVSAERVSRVADDVRDFLKGTLMEDVPICPVSSQTLDGFAEFYDVLVNQVRGLVRQRKFGIFRMPIERVFAKKGFGTVVMGIPLDGTIAVGAQVEVVPGNQQGKVRGIQRFLRDASEGGYGQCLALNIPDFRKRPPARGQVVCVPGYLRPSNYFHASVKVVSGVQKPLRNAEEIKFHTGTVEEAGKIYPLENKTLGEGQTGFATVVLARPVAAAVHDTFIIRRPSPAATVAGGEILRVSYSEERPRKRVVLDQVKAYTAVLGGVDPTSAEGMNKRVDYFLTEECRTGATLKDISVGTLIPPDIVRDRLRRLVENGQAMALHADYFIRSSAYRSCLSEVESHLQKIGAVDKVLSINLSDLRARFDFPNALWARMEQDLRDGGRVTVQDDKLVLRDVAVEIESADSDLIGRLLEVYEKTGFGSPRPAELPDMLQAPRAKIDKLMEHLCNEGRLVQLTKNVVLSYSHFKKAQDAVVETIEKKGSLDSADFKYVIGSTRKYALAILDFLDSRGVTVRIGNDRKLTSDYRRSLL